MFRAGCAGEYRVGVPAAGDDDRGRSRHLLGTEALKELPVPTHAFIGGSSGNLKEIVALLLEKNRDVRIVINCITLETISEALEVLKKYDFADQEAVQLTASRSKEIGRYHLMMGENPIYIITCQSPRAQI